MHASAALAVLAAAIGATAQNETSTGTLTNATVITDNPVGVVYRATLPETAFTKYAYPDGGNAKGAISATAGPNGQGVVFSVDFSSLPSSGGPFLYHIHAAPVPEDGNCTATGAHLDPFGRGETPACDSSAPETCQVGDLSGKYGKVTADPFTAQYTDLYASTKAGIPSFFGNLSFVLHYANKTRISCANFVLQSTATNGTVTGTPSASSSPAIVTTSAGSLVRVSVLSAGLAGLTALVLQL